MVEVVDATAHGFVPMWYGSFFVGTDARVWPNTLKTCLRLLVFHDHAT